MTTPITQPKVYYRPSAERGKTEISWLKSYHTFSFGEYRDPAHHHFGPLRVINQDFIEPDSGFGTHPHRDMEIITLIVSGELTHQDSLGNGSIIRAGDIQRMSAGTGIEHSEFNASLTDPVHLLQVWILPREKGIEPGYAQQALPTPFPQNQWVLIARPQSNGDIPTSKAITLNQEVSLYQAKLHAGQTLTVETQPERLSWLQVVSGTLKTATPSPNTDPLPQHLSAGDGLGLSEALTPITLTASTDSMLYWFDLPAGY